MAQDAAVHRTLNLQYYGGAEVIGFAQSFSEVTALAGTTDVSVWKLWR